jgi:hypothetical protein
MQEMTEKAVGKMILRVGTASAVIRITLPRTLNHGFAARVDVFS